ncbi:hypothetical protein IUS39_23900 [Mycobacteroides abscessus subsp. massiliense]|uniref:hypothetical protein n=1 Tax=Mycobacteroides abscessus TaxID=36809 RepID=UPI000928FCA7|nr:hypothetical protein [Mycobacteroides abscessus]MBN7428723.1 hypothetical protein [Mycobacteroides abscessus subsp. massiliense]SIN48311.1 Uncharacterised protein [Mycobacteroides abscessus subsp. bolletii]
MTSDTYKAPTVEYRIGSPVVRTYKGRNGQSDRTKTTIEGFVNGQVVAEMYRWNDDDQWTVGFERRELNREYDEFDSQEHAEAELRSRMVRRRPMICRYCGGPIRESDLGTGGLVHVRSADKTGEHPAEAVR